MWFAAAVPSLLGSACGGAEPGELSLVLRGVALDPRTAGLGEVDVRFVADGSDQVVARGTTEGGSLAGTARLFDADALEVGARYTVEVGADLTDPSGEPCPVRGRAVGRSPPFVYTGDDQTVPVAFGCAEQLVRPNGDPLERRIGHAVVPVPGGALVLAGAERFDILAIPPEPVVLDLVASVEAYDAAESSFASAGALIAPRAGAGVTVLRTEPEPAVALVGGGVDQAPGCLDSVERFSPTGSRLGAPLPGRPCSPAAERFPSTGEVLVAGGTDPPYLVLPPDLSAGGRVPEGGSRADRRSPRLVALADGRSILVVGGTRSTEAVPSPVPAELVRVDGDCAGVPAGSGPCVEVAEVIDAPERGLQDAAALWVPCASGAGGAVYVSGGTTGLVRATRRPIDDVWCHRDLGDGAPVVLAPAGRLDRPRSGHGMAAVRDPEPRALVFGGEERGLAPVAILRVDGCSCAPAEPIDQPLQLPWAGEATGARAVTLDDGSVLVVGGLSRPTNSFVFQGSGEAALFFPELRDRGDEGRGP